MDAATKSLKHASVYYTNKVTKAIADGVDGTWGPDAGSVDGYFVGGVVPSMILNAESAWGAYSGTRAMVENALSRHNNIGVWTDTNDGKVYVDESQRIADLDEALRVAKERGEIAIWDIANACEIRVEA